MSLSLALLCAALATSPEAPLPGAAPGDDAAATEPPRPAATSTPPAAGPPGAGVSPIELIPRIELRHSFVQAKGGVAANTTTAEIDIQFLDRVLLRYELPVRDLKTPAGAVSGFGDISFAAITVLGYDPTRVVALITGVVLDTATSAALGAGKQQLVLGGGAAIKPRRWWLAYAVVQEQFSFAGDGARPDVNQLSARIGNIVFGKDRSWYKLDLDPALDIENGVGRLFGTLEVGSLLIGRVGLFARAGTQLLGERQLDYSLEIGVRYLFRLE
jgi:hypothetical protein